MVTSEASIVAPKSAPETSPAPDLAPKAKPGPAPKPVPVKQPQTNEDVAKGMEALSLSPKEQNRNLAEKIGFDFSWNR